MSAISKKIFNGANHYITSPYGKRKTISTSAGSTASFHYGTDYGTNGKKLPQYAIEDGYVFAAQRAKDRALYVWVIYPRIKKAFLHYHLDSYKVRAGQTVKSGTLLGYTGKTGKATGVHLHLGIRDLTRLSDSQIKYMTWAWLQSCAYIDPEKLYYTAPSASVSKPTQTGSASYYPKYTGKSVSLVDALKSLKIDSSFANRKKIAVKNCIKAYLGTAKQNTQMLSLFKAGEIEEMKTSTKFVISAITAIVFYTAASFIALFITGQNIDPALTGAYFAFWTVEIVSLASIKNTKSKRKKKEQKENVDYGS